MSVYVGNPPDDEQIGFVAIPLAAEKGDAKKLVDVLRPQRETTRFSSCNLHGSIRESVEG